MSNQHVFDIHIAAEYKNVGMAILIAYFQSLFSNLRSNCKRIDGRLWICISIEEIKDDFPYWSREKISRLIKKANKLNILTFGNFNEDKFNKTKWYSFVEEKKFLYFLKEVCAKGVSNE
jgi:hypothetical protein